MDMEIPHYIVVDEKGKPQSVIIGWDQFQEIKAALGVGSAQSIAVPPAPSSAPMASLAAKEEVPYGKTRSFDDLPEKTADHVKGGDFKSLKDLGVKLPEAKKRKMVAEDDREEEEDVVDGIKIGKRIR